MTLHSVPNIFAIFEEGKIAFLMRCPSSSLHPPFVHRSQPHVWDVRDVRDHFVPRVPGFLLSMFDIEQSPFRLWVHPAIALEMCQAHPPTARNRRLGAPGL
jgi:hypothetical protein